MPNLMEGILKICYLIQVKVICQDIKITMQLWVGISFFKMKLFLGRSDLLKHMLDKANHYNFIRNHIKQIENLFEENFEGFESEFDDSYSIIKEDIPVLEGT